MAIENELKYVLPIDFNTASLVEWGNPINIQQAYLDCKPYISIVNGKPLFGFRYQKDGIDVSFETNEISDADFNRLKGVSSPFIDGQATLNKGVRLRVEGEKFVMTYKEMVNEELVEIEDTIDKDTFDALYAHCVDPIHKLRYQKTIGVDKWFADFLVDRTKHNSLYFVQAEVEMPEGVEKPSFIPPEIENKILFTVPRNDERFTNRNLSDVATTKALYQSLLPK